MKTIIFLVSMTLLVSCSAGKHCNGIKSHPDYKKGWSKK